MAAGLLLDRIADGRRPRIGMRAMVAVAHPDDETIALGGQLDRFEDLLLVHVTDGAPERPDDRTAAGFPTRLDHASARRREAEAAAALAGIPADRLIGLGIADQEAAPRMAEATRRLAALIDGFRPAAIVTHCREGGHPDHDATAIAVRWALRLAGRLVGLVEVPLYHEAEDGGWAVQRFAEPGGVEVPLGAAELARKRRMLAAHASQATTLARFTDPAERFRPAAPVDLDRPPNAGRVLFERFGWGIGAADFRRFAARAADELGVGGWA